MIAFFITEPNRQIRPQSSQNLTYQRRIPDIPSHPAHLPNVFPAPGHVLHHPALRYTHIHTRYRLKSYMTYLPPENNVAIVHILD